MKASIRALLPAIAIALPMSVLNAGGADDEPPVLVEQPEEVPVEVGSGWYLRGDIGYNFTVESDDAFTFRNFDPVTATYSESQFATGSLDTTFTYSIGAG